MHVSTYARRIGFAAAATTVLATSSAAVAHATPEAAATVGPTLPAAASLASPAPAAAPAAAERGEAPVTSPYDPRQLLVALTLPGQQARVADAAAQAEQAAAEAAEAEPETPTFITPEQLAAIVPQIPADKLATYAAPLNAAMVSGGIDSPIRKAAFVAQLLVESDSFRTFEEYASGRAYEGRADLGNTQPGDGERYKGRGAIQVTGRHNYESVSQATGIDFVSHPELVAAPEHAFSTAVWYWTSRNLNQAADNAGIVRVSELVNGGHHGLAERLAGFQRGLDVFSRM
ncbi:glycoside hydrolase family 19 protein [Rhodococcus triatomae]|uniref:glycoside hydrolase family 19 protein n=1 Tax=Rhodococcus triatomae TaxID=300028 RepID=UPI001FE60BC5|nr:glycoside hydrolase family 19 protein [Rhodococcus triatomae]